MSSLFAILLLVFFWNIVCVRGIAKTFYLHTQVGNPNAAWRACASYGATMVKIRNQREHEALLELVAAQSEFAPYWIGLFHTSNDQLSWGCSDPLGSTYDSWGKYQPEVGGSLPCVEVRADTLWYSADCKSSYKFICQKKTGPCVYEEDASSVTFRLTSTLATQTVSTVSECHNICENFNSGNSCFYVLYREIGECTLFESKPTLISGSGYYSGYSRKCYTGETRTEPVDYVKESTEPPTKVCIAPQLTLANQPTTASRDLTTVASPDETTTTPSDKTTAFADKSTVVSSVETTIASPDETTATPSEETTTLPDRTTVVLPDKTTSVSLDETTVHLRDETTVKENISLRDFTTMEAQMTAGDDTSVTRIQTSTQPENTLQHSGTHSERTSERNTAALTEAEQSSMAMQSTQMVNLATTGATTTPQYSTLTNTVPLLDITQNNCYCPCTMPNSAEDKEQFIQMILDELSMNRKLISAYVRTLTSAPDPRPSAKAVGCTGLVILVSAIVSIVVLDFTTLFRQVKSIKTIFRGKSLK